MWSLVTRRGQRVVISALPAVVGSDRELADLCLPHESIAARHARLADDGAGGLVVTALDGAALETGAGPATEARLTSGDSLVLGRVNLRVVDDRAGADGAAGPERAGRVAPGASGAPGDASTGDQLELRSRSAMGPRSAGSPTTPAAARSASRGPASARPATPRRAAPLTPARPAPRGGLLHAHLSQLSPAVRGLLGLLLLGAAVAAAWGLSTAIAAG